MTYRLLAIVLAGALLGACAAARPTLPPGAIPVPTDDDVVSSTGTGILCTLSASIPSVVGVLEVDRSDVAWPVSLRADDGRQMYVLWPRDFSVRVEPEPALLDETGSIFLRAGSSIELGQVGMDPSIGSKDRPYVARGLIGTGLAHIQHCYVQKA